MDVDSAMFRELKHLALAVIPGMKNPPNDAEAVFIV